MLLKMRSFPKMNLKTRIGSLVFFARYIEVTAFGFADWHPNFPMNLVESAYPGDSVHFLMLNVGRPGIGVF